MPRFGGELREVRQGHRDAEGPMMVNHPGDDMELGVYLWRLRGERIVTGTTEDVGMRHGAQVQTADAGMWWARATPRWEALCTRRGDG